MKRFLVAVSLVACGVVGFILPDTTVSADNGRTYCTRLAEQNRQDTNLPFIMNYHGCDERTDRNGRMVGYQPGDAPCEKEANRLSTRTRLTGTAYNRAMDAYGCVLYEDWSWGAE